MWEALKHIFSKVFSRNTLEKEYKRKYFSPSILGWVPDGPKKSQFTNMFKNTTYRNWWVGK